MAKYPIKQMVEKGMDFSDATIALMLTQEKIQYSHKLYERLSRGIHTRGRLDDYVDWLIEHDHEELIE